MDDSLYYLPSDTHAQLIVWAKWARASHIPAYMAMRCASIESRYLPEAGEVLDDTSEKLSNALNRGSEAISDQLPIQVEIIVMRLPSKHKEALRLHYVAFHKMPINQKRRKLGVSHNGYYQLVHAAGLMVRNNLHVLGL